jgi:hypothetical protein
MKKLSDTLKTLVGLEREAYGVGSEPPGGNSDPKQFTAVDPIEAAKQYALLMNS